jgi:deoxyribonuclease-4
MVKVGVHVSIAGSVDMSVGRAVERGCDVFQIFSRNPRGWAFKGLTPEEQRSFRENVERSGLLAFDHMPYLPNLATPKEDVYEKTVATLIAELKRCEQLGIPYLVTHLGHHLGDGIAEGRQRVARAIRTVLHEPSGPAMLLLENTAGEKNSVGSSFEDIRAIIDLIGDTSRIGCCFDTCHAFAAGYEVRSRQGLDETIGHFDEVIGLGLLKVIHLNDAKGERGSGLDRHEHIGLGAIGEEGFRRILHHKVLCDFPFICETPVDERRDDVGNIKKVRELAA